MESRRPRKRACKGGVAPSPAAQWYDGGIDLGEHLLAMVLDFAGGVLCEAVCRHWAASRPHRRVLCVAPARDLGRARAALQSRYGGVSIFVHQFAAVRAASALACLPAVLALPLLCELRLCKIALGPRPIALLLNGLRGTLRSLSLSGSRLGNRRLAHADAALEALSRCTRLEVLRVPGAEFQDGAFQQLRPLTKLRHLDLGANQGVKLQNGACGHALAAMGGLKTLRLGQNALSGAPRNDTYISYKMALCATSVTGALRQCAQQLTELDLTGMRRIADLMPLARLHSMETLLLHGCTGFDDATARTVLCAMPRLRVLNLSRTRVGREQPCSMAGWLSRLAQLRVLLLQDVQTHFRSASEVEWEELQHLHTLSLSKTLMSGNLPLGIAHLPSLTALDVGWTKLSGHSVAAVIRCGRLRSLNTLHCSQSLVKTICADACTLSIDHGIEAPVSCHLAPETQGQININLY